LTRPQEAPDAKTAESKTAPDPAELEKANEKLSSLLGKPK
jgi:hypothetical protein